MPNAVHVLRIALLAPILFTENVIPVEACPNDKYGKQEPAVPVTLDGHAKIDDRVWGDAGEA